MIYCIRGLECYKFNDMMVIKLIQRDAKESPVKAFHVINQYKYVNIFISIH
jgi:hypothetical protein